MGYNAKPVSLLMFFVYIAFILGPMIFVLDVVPDMIVNDHFFWSFLLFLMSGVSIIVSMYKMQTWAEKIRKFKKENENDK